MEHNACHIWNPPRPVLYLVALTESGRTALITPGKGGFGGRGGIFWGRKGGGRGEGYRTTATAHAVQ